MDSDQPVNEIKRDLLTKAIETTCGDRNVDYGGPRTNFRAVATLWEAWEEICPPGKYSPEHDYCIRMILVKLARIATGVVKEDNYLDGIGYFANAWEMATLNPVSGVVVFHHTEVWEDTSVISGGDGSAGFKYPDGPQPWDNSPDKMHGKSRADANSS